MEPLAGVMKAAGMSLSDPVVEPGGIVRAYFNAPYAYSNTVTIHKIYTPRPDISQKLQRALAEITGDHHLNPLNDYKVRAGSLQTRTIGGQPALTCILDSFGVEHPTDSVPNQKLTVYATWIATEGESIDFWVNSTSVGTFRWRFEPFLAALRIP